MCMRLSKAARSGGASPTATPMGAAVIRRPDAIDGGFDDMLAGGISSALTSAGKGDESVGGCDEVGGGQKTEEWLRHRIFDARWCQFRDYIVSWYRGLD